MLSFLNCHVRKSNTSKLQSRWHFTLTWISFVHTTSPFTKDHIVKKWNFRMKISYDFKCDSTPKQRIDRLYLVFRDEAPSKSSVYNWFAKFNRGNTTFGDEFREGRLSMTVVPFNDGMPEISERNRHVAYRRMEHRRVLTWKQYIEFYMYMWTRQKL